jgi:transposase
LSEQFRRFYVSVLTNEKSISAEGVSDCTGVGVDLGLKEFVAVNDGQYLKTEIKQKR